MLKRIARFEVPDLVPAPIHPKGEDERLVGELLCMLGYPHLHEECRFMLRRRNIAGKVRSKKRTATVPDYCVWDHRLGWMVVVELTSAIDLAVRDDKQRWSAELTELYGIPSVVIDRLELKRLHKLSRSAKGKRRAATWLRDRILETRQEFLERPPSQHQHSLLIQGLAEEARLMPNPHAKRLATRVRLAAA